MVKTIQATDPNPYGGENYKAIGAPVEGIREGHKYTIQTFDKKYSRGYRVAQFLKALFLTLISVCFALISPKIRNSFKKAVEGHFLKELWIDRGPVAQPKRLLPPEREAKAPQKRDPKPPKITRITGMSDVEIEKIGMEAFGFPPEEKAEYLQRLKLLQEPGEFTIASILEWPVERQLNAIKLLQKIEPKEIPSNFPRWDFKNLTLAQFRSLGGERLLEFRFFIPPAWFNFFDEGQVKNISLIHLSGDERKEFFNPERSRFVDQMSQLTGIQLNELLAYPEFIESAFKHNSLNYFVQYGGIHMLTTRELLEKTVPHLFAREDMHKDRVKELSPEQVRLCKNPDGTSLLPAWVELLLTTQQKRV